MVTNNRGGQVGGSVTALSVGASEREADMPFSADIQNTEIKIERKMDYVTGGRSGAKSELNDRRK
jgi:hypothetical protein